MAPSEKSHKHHEVFSAKNAAHLDTRFRRFLYRPRPARGTVRETRRPGARLRLRPGIFYREFAKLVGENGLVIAADLQEEMLAILRGKLGAEGLLSRVRTHRCEPDSLALTPEKDGQVNAAFAIFVVHEVPDGKNSAGRSPQCSRPAACFSIPNPRSLCPVANPGRAFRSQKKPGSGWLSPGSSL